MRLSEFTTPAKLPVDTECGVDEAKKKRPKLKATGDANDPAFQNRDRNFVAKHQGQNRSAKHRDKKNDYQRKPKHSTKDY